MHGELKIGNAVIFFSEFFPNYGGKSVKALGGTPAKISIYVEHCDEVFNKAVKNGAKETEKPKD